MTSTSGASSLRPGLIDPSNPNDEARCLKNWNVSGGGCFRLSSDGLVLDFYPDINGTYGFELTAEDDVCALPREQRATISVSIQN
jgi:hypothetical protein